MLFYDGVAWKDAVALQDGLFLVLPGGCKGLRRNGQHEPGPMHSTCLFQLLEDLHGLGTIQEGLAGREFDQVGEGIGGVELDVVA